MLRLLVEEADQDVVGEAEKLAEDLGHRNEGDGLAGLARVTLAAGGGGRRDGLVFQVLALLTDLRILKHDLKSYQHLALELRLGRGLADYEENAGLLGFDRLEGLGCELPRAGLVPQACQVL